VNIWQSYKQERGCFVLFLGLLAVCWPSAQVVLAVVAPLDNIIIIIIIIDIVKVA